MRLFKKIKSNKGSTTTILGLAIIMLVLLMGVFMIDVSKNLYIKNIYYKSAQRAAEVAIKSQNVIGGLAGESGNAAIREYMTQRNGGKQTAETSSHRQTCELSGSYPKITIRYDKTRNFDVNSTISYTSNSGNQIAELNKNPQFFKTQYKVIDIEVTDVVDNYFMSIFGKPCQEVTVRASSISTGTFDALN